jgi:hypothetical protein
MLLLLLPLPVVDYVFLSRQLVRDEAVLSSSSSMWPSTSACVLSVTQHAQRSVARQPGRFRLHLPVSDASLYIVGLCCF